MEYWDPLRKKQVTATPEEQVRQWFIMQLRDVLGVPLHMMMSEVSFKYGQKQYRADIIVYDKDGQNLAVVECKRPDVAITADVALQAMRYNSVLGVKFIILTNGKLTYLYSLDQGTFRPCSRLLTYTEMLCPQK